VCTCIELILGLCAYNAGLYDEFGKDLKPQLEMQLSSILRRLRQTISLAQQFDGRSARVGAEGEDKSSRCVPCFYQTSHVSRPKMLNMNHLADLAASVFTKTVPSPYSKSRF